VFIGPSAIHDDLHVSISSRPSVRFAAALRAQGPRAALGARKETFNKRLKK
jgi:hypothetical protein